MKKGKSRTRIARRNVHNSRQQTRRPSKRYDRQEYDKPQSTANT
jgi:hypothetical protein